MARHRRRWRPSEKTAPRSGGVDPDDMKVSRETSEHLVSCLPHGIPWIGDECENSNVWEERAWGLGHRNDRTDEARFGHGLSPSDQGA